MADVVENSATTSQYSKIVSYEVWNFMSIAHALVTFDDRGILNFKGYNDSGKSNMLRALEVCLFNKYPTQQNKFIRDDCEYFRIVVRFDDGVSILRDKYANGKSLYEMYSGANCIYSTKQNGVLTKVADVPEEIATYLGMISYDGIYLNSRNCYDRQLLVETKGKENYDFLNSVLKSEELSVAGAMLNADKNKLLSEKTRYEAEYDLVSKGADTLIGVTEETVAKLEELDKSVDQLTGQRTILESMLGLRAQLGTIPNIPELNGVDTNRLSMLESLIENKKTLDSLPNIPSMKELSISKLEQLDNIERLHTQLDSLQVTKVELPEVNPDNILLLEKLISLNAELNRLDGERNMIEAGLEQTSKEIAELQKATTHKVLVCKNCGNVLLDEEVCGNELV